MTSPSSPESPSPTDGTLLGPWRLLECVGGGNNGLTYRAVLAERPDTATYALKLARRPYDARFEREAELLSRLRHPSLPTFHDKGTWRGPQSKEYPYLVMGWVEGVPLYDWIRFRTLTSRQALRMLAQVARALEQVHRHGVHRDVKGDNIFVNSEGRVTLLDFGCCWYEGARPLTEAAIPPGTEPYRSPQALRHRYRYRNDWQEHYRYPPADDVYALGVTAYYLLTRTYPPPRTDPECADDPERPRPAKLLTPSELATVHPELAALVMRMLSEEPQARGTDAELAEALEKAAESPDPEVDLPVRPSPSMRTTEKASRPGPPRGYWLRKRARLLASVGAFASLVLVWVSTHPGWEQPVLEHQTLSQAAQEEPQDAGVQGDGGNVGMGEEVLTAPISGVGPASEIPGALLDLPNKPLQGQRRPPCIPRLEVELRGGCWIQVPPDTQACREIGYQDQGSCYLPSLTSQRKPTSNPP